MFYLVQLDGVKNLHILTASFGRHAKIRRQVQYAMRQNSYCLRPTCFLFRPSLSGQTFNISVTGALKLFRVAHINHLYECGGTPRNGVEKQERAFPQEIHVGMCPKTRTQPECRTAGHITNHIWLIWTAGTTVELSIIITKFRINQHLQPLKLSTF